jgi:hypothetical protein
MRKKIMLLFFGILLIGLISAVPPVTQIQQFSEGYVLKYPIDEVIKQNADYEFEFHVFNISNGLPVTSDITCYFHLYNSTGKHQLEMTDDTASHNFDYSFFVTGGNFTELGEYYYIAQCDGVTGQGGSVLGGFTEHVFIVTPTGSSLDISLAFLYGFILLLIGLLLFFSASSIKKTTSGSWMIAYVCLTYILLYALFGFLYLLSHAYLWNLIIFEKIFYITWFVMGVGFLPFVIIITLYILGQEAKAVLKKNYVNQGYTRDEADELSRKK